MEYSAENVRKKQDKNFPLTLKEYLKKVLTRHFITKSSRIIWSICRFFLIFGLSFVIVYPLMQTISKTFMPLSQYTDLSVVWIPKSFTLENIKNAIPVLNYWTALKDTTILCITNAVLQIVICAITGYGFARFRFRFREPLFLLVILSIIIPTQMIFLANYIQYRFFDFFGISRVLGWLTGKTYTDFTINLINNRFSFWIPSAFGIGIRSGLFIYIFRQAFRNIPKELEEAAQIDGCGNWRIFTRVMVPNVRTSMATVFLFSIVWHWNEYTLTRTFFPQKYKPLAVALKTGIEAAQASLDTRGNLVYQMGLSYASALLFLIPPIILYIFTQKLFVEGVETSGIKG